MVHTLSPLFGPPKIIGRRLAGLTLAFGILALAGCASVPPPDGDMTLAQGLLQSARDAGAADYAPVDLGFAQNKFQMAQDAMARRKYADAANLAAESRADSEVARVRAQLGAARAQIQAKTEENNHLRDEMEQAHPQGSLASPASPASAAPAADANAPVQDMPAPSASVLSAPVSGQDDSGTAQPSSGNSQGDSQSNQGGQL